MKKSLLVVSALATFISAGAAFAQSNQVTGEIVFTGNVTAASCSLQAMENIDLGQPTAESLKDNLSEAAWSTVENISFTNCVLPSATGEGSTAPAITVKVKPGTPADGNAALWASNGEAKKVGVKVQINGEDITSAGGSVSVPMIEGTPSGIPVRGKIVSLGNATVGDVLTTLKFEVDYK